MWLFSCRRLFNTLNFVLYYRWSRIHVIFLTQFKDFCDDFISVVRIVEEDETGRVGIKTDGEKNWMGILEENDHCSKHYSKYYPLILWYELKTLIFIKLFFLLEDLNSWCHRIDHERMTFYPYRLNRSIKIAVRLLCLG